MKGRNIFIALITLSLVLFIISIILFINVLNISYNQPLAFDQPVSFEVLSYQIQLRSSITWVLIFVVVSYVLLLFSLKLRNKK
jgi:hypothetical protein